jgi:hypothetical protein
MTVNVEVKLSLCLTKHHAMKTYVGMKFLTVSALLPGSVSTVPTHSTEGSGRSNSRF